VTLSSSISAFSRSSAVRFSLYFFFKRTMLDDADALCEAQPSERNNSEQGEERAEERRKEASRKLFWENHSKKMKEREEERQRDEQARPRVLMINKLNRIIEKAAIISIDCEIKDINDYDIEEIKQLCEELKEKIKERRRILRERTPERIHYNRKRAEKRSLESSADKERIKMRDMVYEFSRYGRIRKGATRADYEIAYESQGKSFQEDLDKLKEEMRVHLGDESGDLFRDKVREII